MCHLPDTWNLRQRDTSAQCGTAVTVQFIRGSSPASDHFFLLDPIGTLWGVVLFFQFWWQISNWSAAGLEYTASQGTTKQYNNSIQSAQLRKSGFQHSDFFVLKCHNSTYIRMFPLIFLMSPLQPSKYQNPKQQHIYKQQLADQCPYITSDIFRSSQRSTLE